MTPFRRSAIVVVAVAGLAACGAPHPGLSNGSVSSCYRAIPAARTAVHDPQATLTGIHRVPADTVRNRLPAAARSQMAADNDTVVCAMTFRGHFAAGQVDLAPPDQQGRYAVVLVSSRRLHLVGSVVLDQAPRSLGQRTL